MTPLSRYEQKIVVNYNAEEQTVTVSHSMPKSYVSYRKPRKINNEQGEQAGVAINKKNKKWIIVLQMFHITVIIFLEVSIYE